MDRVLVYELSVDMIDGTDTFLLNMKDNIPNLYFDYLIEKKGLNEWNIHQEVIDRQKGKVYYLSPKRRAISNILDWVKLLKSQKNTHKVVYFNLYSLSWGIPIYLAKLYKYKVIIHAHNNDFHDCGLLLKLLHIINKWIIAHMRVTRLTTSALSTEFFFGKKRAELIYNGIDTNKFLFNTDKRDFIRNKLSLCNKHVYGFVGRLAYQKNPIFLMKIFKSISEKDKDSAFIICGEGNLEKEMREYDLDNKLGAIFLGNQTNIEDYYFAMDVFLLPSRYEGLGIVLIEAQASGLRCITSDRVVPQEARVTELLEYVSLDKDESFWAQKCIESYDKSNNDNRIMYSDIVSASRFNIKTEAKVLSEILSKN